MKDLFITFAQLPLPIHLLSWGALAWLVWKAMAPIRKATAQIRWAQIPTPTQATPSLQGWAQIPTTTPSLPGEESKDWEQLKFAGGCLWALIVLAVVAVIALTALRLFLKVFEFAWS